MCALPPLLLNLRFPRSVDHVNMCFDENNMVDSSLVRAVEVPCVAQACQIVYQVRQRVGSLFAFVQLWAVEVGRWRASHVYIGVLPAGWRGLD
jgi:hypothetical protein